MLDEEKMLVKVGRGEREESSKAIEWVDELKTVIWSQVMFSVHVQSSTHTRTQDEVSAMSTVLTLTHTYTHID